MKLNLGSGYRYLAGYVNIDNREECNPDLVLDIAKGFPYDDNTVDKVRAFDFLEHVETGKTIDIVEEIYRVLKPGSIFQHYTPSTDGRGAFQDPTHLSFWNINSWIYYTDNAYRKLYNIKANFEIKTLEDKWMANRICHTYGVMYAIK